MKKEKTIFLLLFLVIASSVFAKNYFPKPPLFGIPSKTLPAHHWIFRGYEIYDNYTLKWDKHEKKMIALPDSISFFSYEFLAKLRYGITDKLTAIVNIPYFYKKKETGSQKQIASDFGDVVGAFLYRVFQSKNRKNIISVLLFSKYPTGKFSSLSENELPTGSGSYDFGFSLLPEKIYGKWDFRSSAFYLLRGENSKNVNLGDLLKFSISSAYNFNRKFIGEFSLNYQNTFLNTKSNQKIDDSETELLQVVPAIQYRHANRFLLQAVTPLNVMQKRSLGTRYEFWLGLYYLL